MRSVGSNEGGGQMLFEWHSQGYDHPRSFCVCFGLGRTDTMISSKGHCGVISAMSGLFVEYIISVTQWGCAISDFLQI
jgi:hypothetical protein